MLFQNQSEKHISLVLVAVLVTSTLVAGFSVYWALRHHTETFYGRNLQLTLESRLRLIDYGIQLHLFHTGELTKYPVLQERLQSLLDTHGANVSDAVAPVLKAALGEKFSALIVYDPQGRQVASVGRPVQAQFDLPLKSAQGTHLGWREGYLLSTHFQLKGVGRALGTLVVQNRISEIEGASSAVWPVGQTAQLVLCSRTGQQFLRCIPAVKPTGSDTASDKLRPQMAAMQFALAGNAGYIKDADGAGVSLAYRPMAAHGLGAVMRVDSSERLQPLLRQNYYLLPLFLLLIGSGMLLLLRWQILPALRKAQNKEQQTRVHNQELLRNEARIRAVLEQVDEGIISISSEGIIRTLNPATERMFGYGGDELLGKNIAILMGEEEGKQHDQHLQHYLTSGKASVLGTSREVTGRRKDGALFPIELRLGEVKLADEHLFIGSMRDISELKAVEKRMMHLANHDNLTNLPNRNLVQDRAHQALAQAFRQGRMIGVLCLDLDHFKKTNDLMGHPMGDRLLQTVAARILNCVRDEDTVARQGGDEFIVILPNINRFEDIAIVAQKILVTLSVAYSLDSTELYTSASIGVSVYPDDGQDVDTLMRNADTAMYYAKATGRNNFQFFTPKMNQAVSERMSIESKLRHALARNEFLLNFQPIVNIATGKVHAAEALLRWYPESGCIGPDRFIPVAEETGLIVPIGEWVIRAAMRERRQWLDQGLELPRMVVNLSARQFSQKNLVATIGRVLHENGLNPEHLGVEITESLIMDRPEDAVRTLRALSEMGVQVSVDDFGTGYSSLSYLKRFPLHKIKIDRSFINDIATDPGDAAIVTAIIAMAHSLNATVVAEGVETEAQLHFLRERGCDEFQGYYFSRPAPGHELLDKLRHGMPVLGTKSGVARAVTVRPQ